MTKLQPNAETFRIRALAFLLSKSLDQAQLEIQKALELQPNWESIRIAAAMIDYFGALSPVVLPRRIVQWPEPIEWSYVRSEDQSLTRLRDASKIFQELAQQPFREKDERQVLESWYLACLANDSERQKEMVEYCQKLLASDPTHYRAIAWVTARNIEIGLKPSQKALEKLVKKGDATIPQALALVSCYLASSSRRKALKLLEMMKSLFIEKQDNKLWMLWYAQTLVLAGHNEAALEAIESYGDIEELRDSKTIALSALAKRNGNWGALLEHLEKCYEETGNKRFLFECCELMIQQKKWSYAADRAEQLIIGLGTAEALRIAAISTFNDKRFELCLLLLDKYKHLFMDQKLPSELRRARLYSQLALGNFSRAVNEAEVLVLEEPTTEHFLSLAQIYFRKGDLKSLAITARELIERTDLNNEDALRIASLVQWEDKDLAILFWKKTLSRQLEDSLVGSAVSLGYQLGLDQELRALTARMAVLGDRGQGGIRIGSINDLISFSQKQRNDEAKFNEAYLKGIAPIHIVADLVNQPLVNFYHLKLQENESELNPVKVPFLLFRHGGRPLISGFPQDAPQWRLNLDVTAVILAAHLEILDQVENACRPLRISAELVPTLIVMREQLTHRQPSRIQAYQKIINLIERGILKEIEVQLLSDYPNKRLIEEMGLDWVSLFETARASGNYLVDFLPLSKQGHRGPVTALPGDASQHLVNCRGILEVLQLQGPLSKEDYIEALNRLGSEGQKASSVLPKKRALLYCFGNIPEVLADADLLTLVAECFNVHLEKREGDNIRAILREEERKHDIANWLSVLINRLRQGIDNSIYQVTPSLIEEIGTKEAEIQGPSTRCLLAFMKFQFEQNDVFWVDDRHVNSFLSCGGASLIGINEVLKLLVSKGVLTTADYYEKVNRLRAANARFIPVESDEILHHLRRARIEQERIVDSQGLSIIRRYVAACLTQGEILQRPPMPQEAPNQQGEIAFLISFGRAVMDGLVDLWDIEDIDEETRRINAEWIVENLFIDHLGLTQVTSIQRPEQDDRYSVAITLCGLIMGAMSLKENDNKDKSLRRSYLNWLNDRILRRRFEADQLLCSVTADFVKRNLISVREETLKEKKGPKRLIRQVFQVFFRDLPKSIQDELGRDIDFMASIGLKFLTMVSVDDLNFDHIDFWRSAADAINGREATISPIQSDTEITFRPEQHREGEYVFSFQHPTTKETRTVQGDNLGLLAESPAEREKFLSQRRFWFDCKDEVFYKAVAEIASIESYQGRIEAADVWRNSSAPLFYKNLHSKLAEPREFRHIDLLSSLLPPDVRGLLRYLRLEPSFENGGDFKEALSLSARDLTREEGIEAAIYRLSGLPAALPDNLINSIAELSVSKRDTLIRQLLRTSGSPLARIHLIHILTHTGSNIGSYFRLAQKFVRKLLSGKGKEEVEAFLKILNWVNDEFSCRQDILSLSSNLRFALIWSHTNQLFMIFTSIGAPTDWLAKFFQRPGVRIPGEILTRDSKQWYDVAHPRNVNQESFILHGLSYSFHDISAELIDGNLKNALVKIALVEAEGIRIPTPGLMRDTTYASNNLNSFLGGDRGEVFLKLLGAESASAFTRTALRSWAEKALNRLATGSNDFPEWGILHAVMGDFKPDDSLAHRFKELIQRTEFPELYRKDGHLGNLAVLTSSLQLQNFGDQDLRDLLKGQLIKLARLLADSRNMDLSVTNQEDLLGTEETWSILLESAFNISLASPRREKVIPEFADLLMQLVDSCPPLATMYRPVIQRFCEELPIDQAKQFWPLLVYLRALP